MRILIIGTIVLWAGLFAAVVMANTPSGPAGQTSPSAMRRHGSTPWAVYQRTPGCDRVSPTGRYRVSPTGCWRWARGPFATAEACLHVSDDLNNRYRTSVFDCDEVEPQAPPAARHSGPGRTDAGGGPDAGSSSGAVPRAPRK